MLKTIAQRGFQKLVAVTSRWSQSKNSVPRLSNLLYTNRGGLTTCDGSLIISLRNGLLQTGDGSWTELFLFQPVNVARYYIGIKKAYESPLAVPTTLAAADGGAGGTLGAGTYKYVVTALDNPPSAPTFGETTVSNEATIAIAANHLVNLTWTAVTNAQGYNVYRTIAGGASGSETLIGSSTTNSFQDNGLANGTQVPTAINTTQTCLLYRIPSTSYGAANILATFPADAIFPQDGTPGGDGGGGGVGPGDTTGGAPPSPAGGFTGNVSPLPQIVQFANKAIIALGNGFAPQTLTDPTTVAAISNTFTSIYPDWNANITFNVGDLIRPTVNNAGGFVFKCTQGGISGPAAPVFPQVQFQVVAEANHNVLWQNQGVGNTSPAPRGAAHVEVYAGSLWVFNTSPSTTADNFDGPTCLKMSDLNNPNSWNPLNTAFIGKDDGTQGTGLKAFTVAAEGIAPTGSLVAFKDFKTYQIVGVFGASDFAIQEVQTDMGCIASRSIQFLPGFGIARLTHLGIAVFDGVRDKLISEEIRPYLFGGQPDIFQMDMNFAWFSKGSQCANPPMYMLATPIALNYLPLNGEVAVDAFSINIVPVATVSTFTVPATYFLRVSAFTNINGASTESYISREKQIRLNDNTQSIRVNSLNVGGTGDPNATSYRVYIGTQSGAYTKFIALTAAQMNTGVTFTALTGFTTFGNLNYGIGNLTRLFCYDLVLKAWTIIDLPFGIGVLKQARAIGTLPITVTGGFNDASFRRLQSGDTTFDGSPIQWSMRSAEVFGKAASGRVYYRQVTIRGVTTQPLLTITSTLNVDGRDGSATPVTVYLQGNVNGTYDFLAQVDCGVVGYNAHINISGTGFIEITSIDWEAVALPDSVPPVI